ncbi:glycosyltransferase [Tissierella pigra]|uniref:Glycosyltransferase n=1 Tax=Tissierella pigra TaxID=2607614 RepID=A0A6N7Y073_9FIRM|nr:glycosyltransferase [Tissierella pigra]MSU02125.1 glycosyltransferase [Tissierella pigra]
MKNIAIIISSLKGGGAERVASNITINLSKEKYKVYLILFDSTSMEYSYGGELIDINIKANNNPISKVLNFIRRYFKIKEIKTQYKIDISISFLGGPNLLNILTKGKDKVVVSVRGYTSRKSKGIYPKLGKYLIKKTYNDADAIVGVSNLIKHDLVTNYNIEEKRVLTIYNPYDLKKIEMLSKEKIDDVYENIYKEKVVITVGRLNHLKGHWHLIRAFKKINDSNKDIKLVILGEGELREYLQSLIDDLNLSNNVFLLGFKSNPYKYINKSSIFILPSLSEGFPNALAESMACGIPVISSDCKSGPREILAPETDINLQSMKIEYAQHGILVPVCDGNQYNHEEPLTKEEDIMADAILELLDDKELYERYTNEALKRVRDFEINTVIKEWENVID